MIRIARTFALLLALAAPLGAQLRPSDSTQIKLAKQKQDSVNLLVATAIAKQCAFSVQGFFKPACQWSAPLGQRLGRSLDSALILSRGMLAPRTDTILRTVYDTLKLTVHDTLKVTTTVHDTVIKTVTIHDTVVVIQTKPPIDTVKPPVDTTTKPPVDTVKPPPLPADTSAPKLPALLITTVASTPSVGRTLVVAATGNLQAALDSSRYGDRILLACFATYTGNFTLTAKPAGAGWVTVTTSCAQPSEGTRTSPAQLFARITSPNVLPALYTIGAAARWRFIGVEVTTSAGTNQGLVSLGCASQCETTLTTQPTDIIFDRSYIHAPAATDVRRCVGFNGARMAIVDSYVSDCHSAFDAQAVAGWNGPGPFKIVNNYLEGAAETIAFGGGDPVVPGLIPSDIEVRRNHITKPMSWKTSAWSIKNLVEFKIGRRILVEGNVIENVWPSGQNGFAFVLWSVNQQTTCTWCVTEHLTIQNNLIRNVTGGWSMVATGANGMAQYLAQPMNHVLIRNNIVIGLNNPTVSGSSAYGRIFEMSDTIRTLTIEHNTAFSPTSSSFLWGGALPLVGHTVRNNLVGGGQYQVFSVYGQGQTAWDKAGGPGSVFDRNAVAEFTGGSMVAGNWADSFAAFGIANPYGVTATLDSFILPATSILKGRATDGTDVGADIAKIKAAILGVVVP